MIPTSEEDKKAIWDEIMNSRMLKNDDLLPGERTIRMLMQEYNQTEDQVRRKIKLLNYKKMVTKRRVVIDGKSIVVYTIIEGLT